MRIIATYKRKDDKELRQDKTEGWLFKEDAKSIEIVTPFGWHETYEKRDKRWTDENGTLHTTTIERPPLTAIVEEIEQIRRKGNENFQLSEQGGLTGQFEGQGAGLYEATLGYWLYQSGKFDLAARVLLPAIDTLYLDDQLVEMVRDRLANNYGYRMIAAFVGARDYQQAARLAKLMKDHFGDTEFHAYAVELNRQLPKRQEDFKTLTLP